MSSKLLVLAAIGLTLGSGCSTPQYVPQPEMISQPPTACLISCPTIPHLQTANEAGAVMWVYEVIDAAGECRRLHDECRESK